MMTERREKVIRKTVDRNHADMRLDRYASKVTLLSKGDIQKNIRKKNIKLNGRRAQGSDRVREGDEVTFYIPDSLAREEQTAVKKEHKKLPFRVLFKVPAILNILFLWNGSDCTSKSSYPAPGMISFSSVFPLAIYMISESGISSLNLSPMAIAG